MIPEWQVSELYINGDLISTYYYDRKETVISNASPQKLAAFKIGEPCYWFSKDIMIVEGKTVLL